MDLSDDQLRAMLRMILRIRRHERIMADKMLSDLSYRAHNHFYAGQEAVATGVCAALRNHGPFDQIDLAYLSHRPTGHGLAKGVDMAKMQISDPLVGFIGADGMIGPGHATATGSAFAFRARGSDQVSVVFGGQVTRQIA